MKIALTIAASDSSSGAGIQVDLAVFRELGVYGTCAVTNVTSQNSRGVSKVYKVPPRIINSQIDAVARDFDISACKLGMLYSPQTVDAVAERIGRRGIPNVVYDPVMAAKNDERLMMPTAINRIKRNLINKLLLITPNADEASALTGIAVNDIKSAGRAAEVLTGMGVRYALIKGGHIEGEPVDILYDGDEFIEFPGNRIDKRMHGTGCVLSAAIAARLALGDDVPSAVSIAKDYIQNAIRQSVRLGKGELDYFTSAGG